MEVAPVIDTSAGEAPVGVNLAKSSVWVDFVEQMR